MKLKQMFEGDDRAVSPVIGVILMVAITVILAAVIATFVLGLGDSVSKSPTASVSIDESTNANTVTLVSLGQGADKIQCGSSASDTANAVGKTMKCNGPIVAVDTDNGETAVIRTQ